MKMNKESNDLENEINDERFDKIFGESTLQQENLMVQYLL